jgi:hypothetical protein
MRRTLLPKPSVALTLGLITSWVLAAPAEAFWERSQWSRCSDAPTAAEWNRHRCWEIEAYHDAIGYPGYGVTGGHHGPPYPPGRSRRGGVVVQRLG